MSSGGPDRPVPDRPVIVLGCPRSGTTMLQVALHAHPRMAIGPETWLLVDAYRDRLRFGDLQTRVGKEALVDWLLRRRKVRDLRLGRERVHELVLEAPPTLGSALGAVLQGYAQRFDKPRWGDKRPAYYQDVPAVLRLFPDAQFVHLVRDPRACVASLQRMPWWQQGTPAALAAWVEAVDYGAHWRTRLGPSSWHELRYEQLVADPEPELRRLCDYLGEAYDPAMTQPDSVPRAAVPRRKTWHSRARSGMDSDRTTAYREGLDLADLQLVERVAGSRLQEAGYELEEVGRPPARLLAEYARVAAHRRLSQRKLQAQDLLRDRRAGTPVAALLTSGQRALAGLPPVPGPGQSG